MTQGTLFRGGKPLPETTGHSFPRWKTTALDDRAQLSQVENHCPR
jgi:hypothetical protein